MIKDLVVNLSGRAAQSPGAQDLAADYAISVAKAFGAQSPASPSSTSR
jgi:hypothetical protein